MCWSTKTLYTVCAHGKWEVIECMKYAKNQGSNKSHIRECLAAPCQHSNSLRTIYGFCDDCVEVFTIYTDVGYPKVSSYNVIKNYWAYKQAHGWDGLVEPWKVPAYGLLLVPPSLPTAPKPKKNKFFATFLHGSADTTQTNSISWHQRTLLRAMNSFELESRSCKLCNRGDRQDKNFAALAMKMCESTLEWADGLGDSDTIIHRSNVDFVPELSFSSSLERSFTSRQRPSMGEVFSSPFDNQRAGSPEEFPMRSCRKLLGKNPSRLARPIQMPEGISGDNILTTPRHQVIKHRNVKVSPSSDDTHELRDGHRDTPSSGRRSHTFSDFSGTYISDDLTRLSEETEALDLHEYPRQCHAATYDRLVGWSSSRSLTQQQQRLRRQTSEETEVTEERIKVHLDDGNGSFITRVRHVTFVSPPNMVSSMHGSLVRSDTSEDGTQGSPTETMSGTLKPPPSGGHSQKRDTNRRKVECVPAPSSLPEILPSISFDNSPRLAGSTGQTIKKRYGKDAAPRYVPGMSALDQYRHIKVIHLKELLEKQARK
nr:uncharacterized protein CTRU02_00824 [Colletotrichum truncatum]KAF6800419.1 hypothetical protein CTRU02_00824 [Colletotrichum truncatum]